MNPPPPSADLLLEHRTFLQRLARSLVVDEQHAEDVVQETYLAVLRRPPPATARLGAWLAAVTRNLALRSRRTQGRVRRREERAARPEACESAAEVAARMELQRRIVDAVAALPEPARSAVVWRYFDGLTPTAIAAREGVPVRTIESRLRRARAALRDRMGHAHGSSGDWRAALLPLTGWSAATRAQWTTATTTAASGGAPTASALGAAAVAGAAIMGTQLTVGIAAACAAAAFLAGWQLRPGVTALDATPDRDDLLVEAPLLGTEATALRNAEQALEAERAETDVLRARVRELETHLAAAPVSAGAAAVSEADASGPGVYAPAGLAEALAGADWRAAGEAVANLVPLLARLESAFREETEMEPAEIAGISRWNSPLVQLALKMQGKVRGTGTNGAFSHPAVAVNLIAATLERAGHPLSRAQLEMLGELGDRYLHDDERREQAYGEGTLVLQRTFDEAALKDRFFAGADALLDSAQHDVLHPPAVRGRLGVDLFCSGVIWHPLSRPVNFSARSDLAPRLTDLLMNQLEVSATHREVVADAAAGWARSFSDEELAAADDEVLRASGRLSGGLVAGWAQLEYARACAVKMLTLEHRLLEGLPPDGKAARILHEGAPYIAMPVRK